MSETLFTKIIRKEIPAKIEYEDEELIVIHDINPQAPVHLLIIPKKPIDRIANMEAGDITLLGKLIYRAKLLAQQKKWNDYRLVLNNGEQAGQSVFHVHLHLLSGRPMKWPPG